MNARGKSPDAARRHRALSLSDIVERLLSRESSDHSSVTIKNTAKGDTQVEVTVRSSQSGEINTVGEAAREAIRIYDVLRARYPMSDGLTAAAPIRTEHMP